MSPQEFISELYHDIKKSEIIYKEYLDSGKKFKHARQLKIINSKIWESLIQNKQLLSSELQKDSTALIEHYKIWTEKWESLEKELNPLADDEFVFQNDHTFPKLAAKNIEQAYFKLNIK
jgi:hypothetical protein